MGGALKANWGGWVGAGRVVGGGEAVLFIFLIQ